MKYRNREARVKYIKIKTISNVYKNVTFIRISMQLVRKK